MKTLFSNLAWPSRILYYTNKVQKKRLLQGVFL